MEASLLVIMLDWFKAVKSYEWIQKKKKVCSSLHAVCCSSTISHSDFFNFCNSHRQSMFDWSDQRLLRD